MSIQLGQPYKIIERKRKRYEEHYHIPSVKCIVIPLKIYGDEFSCDVKWEDELGNLQQQANIVFTHQNLEPVNPLKDFLLHELWQKHYKQL